MSHALNIFTVLLKDAANQAKIGRTARACAILNRLLHFAKLPRRVAREAHTNLGELHLEAERYRRAAKHLREALRIDPRHAESRHLLGRALEQDPHADNDVARKHLKIAHRDRPDHAPTVAALGRIAFRSDRTKVAVRLLRRAHLADPRDLEILESLTDVLLESGRPGAAKRILSAARFAFVGDQRYDKLWRDFRFDVMRNRQRSRTVAAEADDTADPVVLTFPSESAEKRVAVRHDGPSTPGRPHFHKLSMYRLKQRRAK